MNGMVKNIPMQHPNIPIREAREDIMYRPIKSKGCLDTRTILDVIASVAFKSLKIINGMTNIVMKLIIVETSISKYCIPK